MLLFRVQLPVLEISHEVLEIHFIIFYIVVPKLRDTRKVSELLVRRGTEQSPDQPAVPHSQSQICPGTAEVGVREGRRGDTQHGEGTDRGRGAVGSHKKCCSSGVVWARK